MIWQTNNLKQKWNYGLSSLRTVWALVQLLLDLDIEVFLQSDKPQTAIDGSFIILLNKLRTCNDLAYICHMLGLLINC